MAMNLKITFTGGALLGDERDLSLAAPLLLGRSHSADVRLKEPDVSGRHVEVRAETDGVYAVCISRHGFELNGSHVQEGERRKLSRGDVVTMGSHVKFRVDAISGDAPEASDFETFATRAPGDGNTVATSVLTPEMLASAQGTVESATFATHVGGFVMPSENEDDDVPQGSLEEASVADSDSIPAAPKFTAGIASAPAPAPAPLDDAPLDDAPTADEPLPPADEPLPPVQDATMDFGIPPLEPPTGTDTGSGDGETVEMKTRQASMDEIFRMKRMLEAKNNFRRKLAIFGFFAFAAILGGVVFATWPRDEKWLSHPLVHGSDVADMGQYIVKSDSGGIDMVIDYPNNPNIRKTETKDGLDVVTMTGKNRKVPFRLSFSRRSDSRQLALSLEESAALEMAGLEKKGFVFIDSPDDADGEDAAARKGYRFFEREHPKSCQIKVQRGTRFFRREFRRDEGMAKWHGLLILFRDGRTVYSLIREIPNDVWPRGKRLLREDPNVALYAGFLRRKWESPGKGGLAEESNLEALLARAEKELDRGLVADWPRIAREINALVAASYSASEAFRSRARAVLGKYRKTLDTTYTSLRSRYDRAMINGDSADKIDAYEKCRGAFSWNAADLRSVVMDDPKEWSCQIER